MKKRKKKKTYELTAALRPAFMSGKAQRAQIQEEGGGDHLAFVNKRFQTCKERKWSAGKKKKKRANQWQGCRADEKRGDPYSRL